MSVAKRGAVALLLLRSSRGDRLAVLPAKPTHRVFHEEIYTNPSFTKRGDLYFVSHHHRLTLLGIRMAENLLDVGPPNAKRPKLNSPALPASDGPGKDVNTCVNKRSPSDIRWSWVKL